MGVLGNIFGIIFEKRAILEELYPRSWRNERGDPQEYRAFWLRLCSDYVHRTAFGAPVQFGGRQSASIETNFATRTSSALDSTPVTYGLRRYAARGK